MIPEDDARAILPAPDGEGWLVVSAHGLVWLERESFRRLATYLRRLSRICRARYSADGTRLAVGHLDGSIEILRVSDLQRIGLLRGHRGEIGDVWFIENDQTLISSGREGPLRFWDVESGRSMGTLAVGETSTTLLHFDRQRQHLWALGPNRPTKLWSGARGTTTNRTNSTTEAD